MMETEELKKIRKDGINLTHKKSREEDF